MRLLLLNQFGPESGAPTGRILAELGAELEKRGHATFLLATDSSYGKPRGGLKRIFEEGLSHLRLLARSLFAPRQDIVISLTSPACLAVTAAIIAKIHRARHIHWAMDLYPDVGVLLGELKDNAAVRILSVLMRRAYQSADKVVALDEDMRDYLREHYQVDSAVIEPMSPDVAWPPFVPKSKMEGQWLYSGNFGRAHEIDVLLQIQKKLEDQGIDAELILQGQGPQFLSSRDAAQKLGLRRVQWRDPVPSEQLAASLMQSDVLVVTRKADLKGILLPSKLILARLSGKSILWIGDTDGKTARELSAQGRHGVFTIRDINPIAAWLGEVFKPGSSIHSVEPKSTDVARREIVDSWDDLLKKVSVENDATKAASSGN